MPERGRVSTRRPQRVYRHGSDPDPRFSLANERTALAWVRTGMALVAGGVGLTSLAELADLPRFMELVAALACLTGGAVAVRAVIGWMRVERALRRGESLPPPRALGVLAGLVLMLALVLAGYAFGRML